MESSFIRTASGLNNEHLFHDVDYVVYLEGGGKSFNINEVLNDGYYNDQTLDIAFWSNLFRHYWEDKRLKFKSIGSKTVLKELSTVLIDNDINTVLICMDNEFDELLMKRIADRRVFYTYGYSWENEVFTLPIIKNLAISFSAVGLCPPVIEERYNHFISDITCGVKADFLLFQQDDSIFPKKSRLRFIDLDKVSAPVKQEELNTCINSRGISQDQLDSFTIDTKKYCFGHLVADYSCQLLRLHLKKELKIDPPNNEAFNRLAIVLYYQTFPCDDLIKNHYEQQFSRFS